MKLWHKKDNKVDGYEDVVVVVVSVAAVTPYCLGLLKTRLLLQLLLLSICMLHQKSVLHET